MIHEKFIILLDEKIAERLQLLSTGRCETIQQYAHACGEILGLRRAREEYLELLKALDDNDEEEPVA